MTHAEAITEHYAWVLRYLLQQIRACAPRAGELDPVTPERIHQCAVRKAAMLRAARQAGILDTEGR